MKAEEAASALLMGKKIRKLNWPDDRWIWLSLDGIRNQDGYLTEVSLSGEWCVATP